MLGIHRRVLKCGRDELPILPYLFCEPRDG